MPSRPKAAKKTPGSRRGRQSPSADRTPDAGRLRSLDTTIIDIALLKRMEREKGRRTPYDVIIDPNLLHPKGREFARAEALRLIDEIVGRGKRGVDRSKSQYSTQYLFAKLTARDIATLVARDAESDSRPSRAIYKIWLDVEVAPLLTKSLSTVKADAAMAAFGASGDKICWAVIDSGIEATHPHFDSGTLDLKAPLSHCDFTSGRETAELGEERPTDEFGHGTHVAGIIAGCAKPPSGDDGKELLYVTRRRVKAEGSDEVDVEYDVAPLPEEISGVAPRCSLVSLRVLDGKGQGKVSNIIAALGYVQQANDHGKWLRIQGVNLSVGYEYEAEWFACGQSPLCEEVNRLVRSGVVVVTAAGNTGYGFAQAQEGAFKTGLDVTINDPGNADLAITVGSTHREKPHMYGVSYFSSKGPTADGRLKPDLVAPGEKIVSCAAGTKQANIEKKRQVKKALKGYEVGGVSYLEESGTSMAAPHVSGAIAAFLSIRREFIGQPERVKDIFLSSATDLGRDKYFQGRGLIDLMRAIQSV